MQMLVDSETVIDPGAGDDEISAAETARNLTDEKFIAEFKRASGPSPLTVTLKLAALCAAKKSFSAEKLTLHKVNLSKSKFSKYAQIGRDRRLDGIRDRLPKKAGYSVLYAMSQLSDQQWKSGFDGRIINPRSSRSEIDAFRTGVPKKPPARNQPVQFFAAVNIPQNVNEKDKATFRQALVSLCEEVGFEAVFNANKTATVTVGSKS